MSGYIAFKYTDVEEIDLLLKILEAAGNSFHHTEDWIDEDEKGISMMKRIQFVADLCASQVKQLHNRIAELGGTDEKPC